MRRLIPQVLRDEPQYRLLFGGQLLSVVGDRISVIAIPFAVLAIGGGAGEVGLVSGAQFLPFLLFALPAGVLADRLDRRRLLIASDVVRLAAQATAGLLLVTGQAEVWHLVLTAFAFGSADALFGPAFTGLLPQTVADRRNLQPANALRGMSYSAGSVAGPAIAGLLIALTGPGTALLVDAGTFAVSIACLVPLRPARVERGEVPEPFVKGLAGGFAEVRSRPWVWPFLGGLAVYHAVVLPSVFVLGPVLAEEELGGASSWATIVALFGVGAIAGDLLLLRWRPSRALRAAAVLLIFASLQAAIIGSGLGTAGIAALECLAGIAVTAFFTLWEVTLQEHIPEDRLSRVSSYDYLASAGVMPLGGMVAGVVAEAAGLQATLIGMSVIGVAAALAVLSVRAVRELPRGVAAAQPETLPAPAG